MQNTRTTNLAAVTLLVLLLSGSYIAYATTTTMAVSQVNSPSQGLSDRGDSHSTNTSSTSSTNSTAHGQREDYNATRSGTWTENESDNSAIQHANTSEATFSLAPASSSFTGNGSAHLQLEGLNLSTSVELQGATPNTNYTVVLSVNGTQHDLGNITTKSTGSGSFDSNLQLAGAGTVTVGISLQTNGQPAYVGTPASLTMLARQANGTETDSEANGGQEELAFRVVPAAQSDNGSGQANIHFSGTILDAHIEVEHASPATTYEIYLTAIPLPSSGTTLSPPTTTTTATTSSSQSACSGTPLGSMVTNNEGNGQAHQLEATLSPGTYAVGLLLCESGTPSLVTSPATETAMVTQTGQGTPQNETETHAGHVVAGNSSDESQIKDAMGNKTIPAVVVSGPSGLSASVIDPRFSVSVGSVQNNGIAVTISGNVTGSRVLLINLTKSATLTGNLTVTFDGQQVQEASSLLQVLNTKPTDPASYIIISTSTGLQLLVAIPHFSTHVIQVLPAVISSPSPTGALAPGLPLLAIAVAAVGVGAALLYRTKRVHIKAM